MRNKDLKNNARVASFQLKSLLNITEAPKVGIVLGTGWGDAVAFEDDREVPFGEIYGFEKIAHLEGHARRAVYGRLGGVPVVALRGRMHLNEDLYDRDLGFMVRLQTEMLLQLGVETLIVTSAAGALTHDGRGPSVGSICVASEFVTLFAPDMPLLAGEFKAPNMTLDRRLQDIAVSEAFGSGYELFASKGVHAMLRGPFFEGLTDKKILASFGCSMVGMSMLPEACVAALYDGVKVLGLGFITNGMAVEHSHEENQAEARRQSTKLSAYLGRIVAKIGT